MINTLGLFIFVSCEQPIALIAAVVTGFGFPYQAGVIVNDCQTSGSV
jgi:hypothetical protein